MGLGNGMLVRYKKKGLSLEEIHGEVHNGQISSLQVEDDLLFTASNEKQLGIHSMSLGKDINIAQLTLLKI
jgi:hypothetical protein